MCKIYQHTFFCNFNCFHGIFNEAISTYHLVKKHVWEEGQNNHHNKADDIANDNAKDCNKDDVLKTGLVRAELLAGHTDVLPPGDHHEADKDRVHDQQAGGLDVAEVSKVLEAALKQFGDNVRSEKLPAEGKRAVSVRGGKPQG